MLCNGCIAKKERPAVFKRKDRDPLLYIWCKREGDRPLVFIRFWLIPFAIFAIFATLLLLQESVRKPQPINQLDPKLFVIAPTEFPFQISKGDRFLPILITSEMWELLRSSGLTLQESSVVGETILHPGHVLLLRIGPIEYFCQVSPDGNLAALPDTVAPPTYFWALIDTTVGKK